MSLTREIINGQHDEELDDLVGAITRRRRTLGLQRMAELKVGDRVRFVSTIRPTYLAGIEAEVVGRKVSKLVVRLLHPVGRFRGDLRVPGALVEPINIIDAPGIRKVGES